MMEGHQAVFDHLIPGLPSIGEMRYMLTFKEFCYAMLITGFSSCSSRTASAQLPVGEVAGFSWRVEPSYRYRTDGQAGRAVIILLKDSVYNGNVPVKVTCNGVTDTTMFHRNHTPNRFRLLLPAGAGVDTAATAELTINYGARISTATILIPRMKQWTVYIYPHSHLDIGYTALPADVKKLQTRNIDVGMDLAEKTQHYPEGARFVWNPEATWIVSNYLREATAEKKLRFIEAVKKGWIQIDGGHSNINTSTCSDEELLKFFGNSKAIERLTGVPITTVVQMDVPGAAWGLVTAAAQYGVRAMISFPNNYDVRKQLENKPFYWLAPDGKTKLFFLQGFPYGIGYTIKGSKYGLAKLQTYSDAFDRVQTTTPSVNFLDPFIFEETEKLERQDWPYDLFAMTWSMADNCVIDADLPEAVKAWNEEYAYPKLVISGASGIVDAFEKKYSAIIPQYRGDFTEFWTNGLGADAASVGKGRRAKEDLVQAETLWSLLQPENTPTEKINQAWENNLLSAEHTWGAQVSTFLLAAQVEKIKRGYFSDAAEESKSLIAEAVAPYTDTEAAGFSVINTLSWQHDGIVTLTPGQSRAGDRVIDDHHTAVPSQRLSTGELIFLAKDVPALASRHYKIVRGEPDAPTVLQADSTALQNDFISLRLDPKTGNINSVKSLANGYEYVDSRIGLNGYYYVTGVYNGQDGPKKDSSIQNVSIRVKEKGPLLVSFMVTATAAGVKNLNREVRLYNHQPSIEFIDRLDKIATQTKEGIHIGFGFHLPGGVARMEMPWSIVTPNVDQISAANKNWFAFQHWVDLSDKDHGVTWSAIESPLIEWGEMSGNILDGARLQWLWKKEIKSSAVFYSWVLNNHWDTNFPLEQGGVIDEHYTVGFHDKYDAAAANHFGVEAHRPFIVVQSKKNMIEKPLLNIGNQSVIISTLHRLAGKKTFMLRVKSVSDKVETVQLGWPIARPKEMYECGVEGETMQKINDIRVEPYGMTSIKLVF